MKMYISFGQAHIHHFGEVVFDKDCLAEIICKTYEEGRARAFELFGSKFCFSYHWDELEGKFDYFPRGAISTEGLSNE